jgi:Na+-driven multidrug efflux pump
MVGASSLALTIFLAVTALSNVFGVGGGSLMARLLGEKKEEDAKKAAAYSMITAVITALVFSLAVLIFMEPLLKLLGASSNTLVYAKQYAFTTVVLGAVPTVMVMCMPQLLRNAGYSGESGFGVILGNLINIALDPLFMFVILPPGKEVLGAGIATLISNIISFGYFLFVFKKLSKKTVLSIPTRLVKLPPEYKKSLYSVGIPAAFSIFLFDLVTIVINRLASAYGDIPLASIGIVLKLERIPVNIGLGVCLGMVPLIAYNYGAGNKERVKKVSNLARNTIIVFAVACALIFGLLAPQLMR